MLEYRIFIIIEMLTDACNDCNSSSTAAVVVTVTSIHPPSIQSAAVFGTCHTTRTALTLQE